MPGTLLDRINEYLVRWIVQKYKRYRGRRMRARDALGRTVAAYPRLSMRIRLPD
ncbi:hypothetical protein [Saccharopolyspora spinosa]|uniref:Group II intron maturase n=1 Tax=Saccharopolyspora spinosa TaxID=60894 RepID=A0A2N3Y1B7_SACSN|nr:hypothetical protein [Saccharopolyspora spinosa]PKW16651.1 hypothetical protein A8926_4504 [Saccharopolyspora spinosa]